MAAPTICAFSRASSHSRLITPYLCSGPFRRAVRKALVLLPNSPSCTQSTTRALQASSAMSGRAKESVDNNPGLAETIDEATHGYIMQQTMYRIKDPKPSLDFYSRVLGMSLFKRFDYPEAKFSLYFMGYENPKSIPTDEVEKVKWTFTRPGTLELTHNWGTESDPDFKGYHNGNSDPPGWGHIGITVDDVYKACERFEKLGVEFVKRPDEGRMKGWPS